MRVLITAGPTRERMDPVRFLSNPSSGSMGIQLAQALQYRGAKVTLVLGPTHLAVPSKIKTIRVESALQMHAAVKKHIAKADAFVATAAVGDWRFAKVASRKIKKGVKNISVKLVKNPDILAEVGRMNPHPALSPKGRGRLLVGFALETDNLEKNGLKKLREKNLDLIIANDPASFSSSHIRPLWMERNGNPRRLGKMSKQKLAQKLAQWLLTQWNKPTSKN